MSISDWSSDVCSSDLQLRGRVGRAKTRAYAYLTTPADRLITETAEKRLKVLSDLDTLGAGFQLASHDLDIRGAGNLVGDEQSGHIKEVGFELYQSMLEEARSEEHTSELQSLMRNSYAVFCLKKKKQHKQRKQHPHTGERDK